MALVKLEIDGKRVLADSGQTVLEVARKNGIDIPTLCHDGQLEPFASCFLCVVKVKGARSLAPSCATRVANGMVVHTSTPEIRASRKAALELLLSNHYADCVGPCQVACPAGVDIQGYIALAALGRYEDAVRLIKERNPLPSTCGRICTRPCEVKGCRRNSLDEPVGIDFLKRYVADMAAGPGNGFQPAKAPPSGKKVAVVGAGPAGLSAAWYLALRGHEVDVLEAQPDAGGMLRYGIPQYRLPKEVLDQEIAQITALGVRLKTGVALGRDFTVKSLKEGGYGAVFLGIGAWSSSAMRVKGEDAPGVLSGIEFLEKFGRKEPMPIHGRVLVVGGGNTAIDCARTALRLGVDEVHIVYRRTRAEMPANRTEIHDAEEEGVALDFLVAPTRVVAGDDGRVKGLECLRMELGEPDASGRRSPKPVRGSEFVMDCDFVIAAIGQGTRLDEAVGGKVPDSLPAGETLTLTRWQTVAVDERTFETTVEGVFSGGDVVTGAATAIEAIAAGRKAAYAIDQFLRTGRARPEPVEFLSRKDTFAKVTVDELRSRETSAREAMPMLPVAERIRSFVEVETGYSPEQAHREATRCLECGCGALFTCDLRRYATEYEADPKRFLGEVKKHRLDRTHPLIELDQNKCIACGRCVRMCSEVVGVAAYGYVNRGFNTVVAPALGGSLLDTDCVSCGLCIGTCPTGAVAGRVSLAKPGPWKTSTTPTVCHYCGVGCRLAYESFGATLVKASRVEDAPVTAGGHCRKGLFGSGYVTAADRLRAGKVRKGRSQKDVPVDAAMGLAARRLKAILARVAPEEIAVFVSPRLTNEEAFLAGRLARTVLRTGNVASFASLVNPSLSSADVPSTATYRDLAGARAILAAGTAMDEEHFVPDLMVKAAVRGGGKLVYVHPEENRVSRFAEVFLRCRPGTQALVVAAVAGLPGAASPEAVAERAGVDAGDVREAAAILGDAGDKVVVFNRDFRGERARGDALVYAAAARALGAGLLGLHEKANGQGLLDVGATPADAAAAEALAERVRGKGIRVAVLLGEDPLGAPGVPEDLKAGIRAAGLVIAADVIETATTRAAHVVLPMSAAAETSGTMTNSERRVQRLGRAVPPVAGVETWQLLCRLGAKLGAKAEWKARSTADVFTWLQCAVPAYRDVVVDGAGRDGLTDAPAPVPAVPDVASVLDGTVAPAATLDLDCLEARFAAWFDGEMGRARERHAAVAETAAVAAAVAAAGGGES